MQPEAPKDPAKFGCGLETWAGVPCKSWNDSPLTAWKYPLATLVLDKPTRHLCPLLSLYPLSSFPDPKVWGVPDLVCWLDILL